MNSTRNKFLEKVRKEFPRGHWILHKNSVPNSSVVSHTTYQGEYSSFSLKFRKDHIYKHLTLEIFVIHSGNKYVLYNNHSENFSTLIRDLKENFSMVEKIMDILKASTYDQKPLEKARASLHTLQEIHDEVNGSDLELLEDYAYNFLYDLGFALHGETAKGKKVCTLCEGEGFHKKLQEHLSLLESSEYRFFVTPCSLCNKEGGCWKVEADWHCYPQQRCSYAGGKSFKSKNDYERFMAGQSYLIDKSDPRYCYTPGYPQQ